MEYVGYTERFEISFENKCSKDWICIEDHVELNPITPINM